MVSNSPLSPPISETYAALCASAESDRPTRRSVCGSKPVDSVSKQKIFPARNSSTSGINSARVVIVV